MLGPILFTLYLLHLGNLITKHCIQFYCYADDAQRYLAMKPGHANQLVKLKGCHKHIKA